MRVILSREMNTAARVAKTWSGHMRHICVSTCDAEFPFLPIGFVLKDIHTGAAVHVIVGT